MNEIGKQPTGPNNERARRLVKSDIATSSFLGISLVPDCHGIPIEPFVERRMRPEDMSPADREYSDAVKKIILGGSDD